MRSANWIVCVCIFVVSGTVARRERRAFGPKALYEPNRTGRISTATSDVVHGVEVSRFDPETTSDVGTE